VKKGYVIRTDPDHGTSVKSGSKVNLIVSSGVKKYTVDDYTGESYTDVAADLRSRGFKVRKDVKYSSSSTIGTILSQSILAGKKVDPEKTTITFTVAGDNSSNTSDLQSSSSNEDADDNKSDDSSSSFELANLIQYNYQALMGYANEHGINVKYSGDQTGLVSSQSPSAGADLSQGDTITVVFKSTSQSVGESGSDSTGNTDTGTTGKTDSSQASSSSSSSSHDNRSSNSEISSSASK
jgi:serine/threonine-protein kinase